MLPSSLKLSSKELRVLDLEDFGSRTRLPVRNTWASSLQAIALFILHDVGTPDEDINRWGQIAFEHFKEEHQKETAAESGVQMITVHQLYEEHETLKIPSWSHIVHNFQVLDSDALRRMGLPEKYVKGYSFGSYVADQKYYLQYISRKLTSYGVKFIQRRIENLSELHGQYGCIINCTGLGAFYANDDTEMYPIRGQVLRVK